MTHPISQTFFIKQEHVVNDNAMFLKKIDLYFKSKPTRSDAGGVTVQLREVENGMPTIKVLPFSEVYKEVDDVNVSSTAATATTFTFSSPVVVTVGKEYAFSVLADGDDPDYELWVSKTGGTDVSTSKKVTQDSDDGVLFTSTNGRTWEPVKDENIKYTLYRGNVTTSSGYVEFTNKNVEFFDLSDSTGTFREGEYAFKNAANSTGAVSVTAGNTTVTAVSGASFSALSGGQHLVLFANTTTYDVLEIASVESSTSLTVRDIPKYTNTSANFFDTIVGKVDYWNTGIPGSWSRETAKLYLVNSSATTSNYFQASDIVKGEVSKASGTIGTVMNKNVSYVQPNIYRTNLTRTKTEMSASRLFGDDGTGNYSGTNVEFNDQTYFNGTSTVVKSWSNEKASSDTDRSFKLKVDMTNLSPISLRYTSPFIDTDIASVKLFEYFINSDIVSAGNFTVGESYIIAVPGTTDFTLIGASDSNVGTVFTATGAGSGTGTAYIDESVSDAEGTAKYISKTITLADNLDAEDLNVYLTAYRPPGTTIDVYAKFLAEDDPEGFDSKVWSQMTGKASNPISQNTNRFDYKEHEFNLQSTPRVTNAAYLNSSGVIQYVNSAGTTFNDFKYFAIKVVFWGDGHHRVPRLADIRAIALAA